MQISQLNQTPLAKFRDLFAGLKIPDASSIRGKYRASFVGPAWLRTSAAPALSLSGLGGWLGKEFREDGTAINIVLRAGVFSTRFPVIFVRARACIDGREGLALPHQAGNLFPWVYFVGGCRRLG